MALFLGLGVVAGGISWTDPSGKPRRGLVQRLHGKVSPGEQRQLVPLQGSAGF